MQNAVALDRPAHNNTFYDMSFVVKHTGPRFSTPVSYAIVCKELYGAPVAPYAELSDPQWAPILQRVSDQGSRKHRASMYADRSWLGKIDLLRPRMIVELGVFRGGGSIAAAKRLERLGLANSFVVSVDTWLVDFLFTVPRASRGGDYAKLPRLAGNSLFYYQFAQNVIDAGMTQRIVPFSSTTTNAAHTFMQNGWHPDLIFVDASHSSVDVLIDMEHWWDILACGGLMVRFLVLSVMYCRFAVPPCVPARKRTRARSHSVPCLVPPCPSSAMIIKRFLRWRTPSRLLPRHTI
jgi:hypothetical protein